MNENQINSTPPFIYYKGILGSKPSLILSYKNNELLIEHADENIALRIDPHEALNFISDLTINLKTPKFDSPPPTSDFQYGLMGFFSFEFGLKLLNIKVKHENANCPDFYFILPTEFSQKNKKYKVVGERFIFETPNESFKNEKPSSNMSKSEYLKTLTKIKTLLTNGETYQINFAQKFNAQTKCTAETLFQKLRKLNPSPQEALLKTANFSIISNSPECLFKKVKNHISTFPIKGTISSKEDPQKLLDSKKDLAELEMIVDLERNDLGKIAKIGSVKVAKHCYLESYANVHHTVSEISAELKPKTTFAQIIEALFPGGSITGCPKKRSSEIIHTLEPSPRGIYCGSLGYLSLNGNSEFNILIRSIWMSGDTTTFHSGGGITIASDPEKEYEETLAKAEVLQKSLVE